MGRRLALGVVASLTLLMAGCWDTVSGPEPLADQKALSMIAKERHYLINVYVEGRTTIDGQPVLVFAEDITSKFGGDSIHLYTLPVEVFPLKTDVGTYRGPDQLRRPYHLIYQHDLGLFELRSTHGRYALPDKVVETLEADFEEEFTLAEERCRNATHSIAMDSWSISRTDYAAAICLWSGDIDSARSAAARLLEMVNDREGYTAGFARHKGHTHLGRIALLDGDTEAAVEHLRRSADVRPSATMMSFGPNMALARDLLAAGETDAVLAYFEACGRFWRDDHLDTWTAQVQRGEVPNFGANLNY